jgi:ABC-type lipoprotein export system ATPase subunit
MGGSEMSDAIVELHEVFCVHRTDQGDAAALQGTNLELGRGELLCLLGPSGAGKSTVLRVIAGLQEPSAGMVRVRGTDIGRASARTRAQLRHEQVGFLAQNADAVLPPDLPAGQAIALPLALRGIERAARERRAAELLELAGLDDRGRARPGELSGGERQRVALCAAVAHRPTLLLADEPTGELDDVSATAIRRLISELAERDGTSVLIASHDPAASEIADRSLRIRDGRVVEDRIGGESALVVGRGGWVRLPSELLEQAGIGERAQARLRNGGVMLTSTGAPGSESMRAAAVPAAPAAHSWSPAQVQLRSIVRGHGRGASRREVLAGLSVEFAAGRLTVVTGRSGSGKTTLLRLIGGLDRADRGELEIDGWRLADLSAEALAGLRRERIGYLPQEPTPVAFLGAEENVVLALALRGSDPRSAAERAAVVLSRLGLADRARQRVSRLSAGEAQRVALARALATARGLLVVDEPTSRLDEANAGRVAELLAEAAAQDGQTVICATHDPLVIERADAVLAL